MSYHCVNSAAERARLLEEMLQLQARIRTQKEKQRLIKTNQSSRYAKIFEPVTKTMEKLSKPAVEVPLGEVPVKDIPVVSDLIDFKEPTIKNEEEDEESEEEEDLFDSVLQTIPVSLRDDGIFGLNVYNDRIGSHEFRVIDNVLIVEGVKGFHITDPDLWRLLLVKNPNSISLKLKSTEKYKPFVEDYKEIVDELNLEDFAYARYGDSMKRRTKYKLLQDLKNKSGSGFLFSVQPPPFSKKRVKPSTVVVPSDKKGLLRALYKAIAELRAGNTSMQNLVVPLAQEAKRKKILPPHLLSPDEKNWVFS